MHRPWGTSLCASAIVSLPGNVDRQEDDRGQTLCQGFGLAIHAPKPLTIANEALIQKVLVIMQRVKSPEYSEFPMFPALSLDINLLYVVDSDRILQGWP